MDDKFSNKILEVISLDLVFGKLNACNGDFISLFINGFHFEVFSVRNGKSLNFYKQINLAELKL